MTDTLPATVRTPRHKSLRRWSLSLLGVVIGVAGWFTYHQMQTNPPPVNPVGASVAVDAMTFRGASAHDAAHDPLELAKQGNPMQAMLLASAQDEPFDGEPAGLPPLSALVTAADQITARRDGGLRRHDGQLEETYSFWVCKGISLHEVGEAYAARATELGYTMVHDAAATESGFRWMFTRRDENHPLADVLTVRITPSVAPTKTEENTHLRVLIWHRAFKAGNR